MTATTTRRRSLARLSALAWTAAVVALILGSVVVYAGFRSLFTARERLFERLQPALVESQRLRSALVDQETGIRGYALSRDDRLLVPYHEGRELQVRIEADLDRLLADEPEGPRLQQLVLDIDEAMERWRADLAEPVLAAPIAAEEREALFLESTVAFDDVRARIQDFELAVDGERLEANAHVQAATARLVVAVGTTICLLGLVNLAGGWVLRRRIVEPIQTLQGSAVAVADGRLDEPIAVDGPSEIAELGEQVGRMRDRILAELKTVEAAREEIDRQLLELARSNEDLEQFAYVASHDLQEPLRKVASFCQLLEQRYDDVLDERGRSYLAYAVDGAKRMQTLITDLLEFSRVGRTTSSFVPCDLDAIAREVARSFDEDLAGGRIDVDPLPTLPGDPALYRVLLGNLIGNAVKYRRAEEAPVVRLGAQELGDEWVFHCTDNGIGIDDAYRDRVLVIFQRLHARDEYSGTGIGLALCKRVVEFMGGRIWVGDAPGGVGTTVSWSLPSRPVLHAVEHLPSDGSRHQGDP